MALVDFTTYDDVRAALGVSDDEIEDDTLALEVYDFNLKSELEDVSLTLAADYATVKAIEPDTRTADQQRFYEATRMFAAYAVSKQLTASLPLFSPKDITDGKAGMSRYAQNPYQTTIELVGHQYERFRTRLAKVYAAYKSSTAPAATTLTYMLAASPASDPVTGT